MVVAAVVPWGLRGAGVMAGRQTAHFHGNL